ncbi:ABC transporter permease [Streptomyces sp. NPDC057494]|uniref:ABC transporter permease n=1 Tax=Streptomyces sp. NPDC057494 TaxID=3346148 RepID=UPI0036824B30
MSTLTLKGPTWVTVRQYRRTLWVAGAAVGASLAVIGGLRIWDAQTPDSLTVDGNWIPANDTGYTVLRWAMEYAGGGMILLPLLVGAFVAGPLIAREFESGTYKVSLTQSVSPSAWLRAKLLTATAVALLATLALTGVFRIGWSGMAGTWYLSWDPGPYTATGIVLFAYVLAAVAVGALVGQLVRRTLVAMAATGLVVGVVVLVMGALRWSILPVQRITGPIGPTLSFPADSLMMETGRLTASGARFDDMICWNEANSTPGTDTTQGLWAKVEAQCQARHGVTSQYIDYHPASHFWPTQLIETGIVLALAALAALAAFRVLRARHP